MKSERIDIGRRCVCGCRARWADVQHAPVIYLCDWCELERTTAPTVAHVLTHPQHDGSALGHWASMAAAAVLALVNLAN